MEHFCQPLVRTLDFLRRRVGGHLEDFVGVEVLVVVPLHGSPAASDFPPQRTGRTTHAHAEECMGAGICIARRPLVLGRTKRENLCDHRIHRPQLPARVGDGDALPLAVSCIEVLVGTRQVERAARRVEERGTAE
jgi:hypothetical protein